jgi:hypothetical protein
VARRLLLATVSFALAAAALAQLVPITRCNAAIPCNIPFGLRPADAATWTPDARQGQGAGISVSAGIEEGLKPRVDTRPVPEDASERAARIFLRKNPPPTTPTRTGTPAPAPTATPAPKAP